MERKQEIDFIKGLAVILMVIYHYFYMAYLMGKPVIDINLPWVHAMAIIAHTTFIFMMGVNLHLSYKRDSENFYRKQIWRALKLLGLGLVMTIITYKLFPNAFIRYGIFHFLASAIIVSMGFIHSESLTSLGASVFAILSFIIGNNPEKFYYLCTSTKNICFNLGLYNYFDAIDHFSFIPFFVYVLLGIKTGQQFYKTGNETLFKINKNPISWIGKNSLNIYIVHWAVLYTLLNTQRLNQLW
jgi:uncharacterized membrane protein